MCLTDQAWGEDGRILALFFKLLFWGPWLRLGLLKCEKRTQPISSLIDHTSLNNKGFIRYQKHFALIIKSDLFISKAWKEKQSASVAQ